MNSDGATRLLFHSYNDAEKTRKILQSRLNSDAIQKPRLKDMTKVDLVGIPYEISKEDAIASLIKDNQDFQFEHCSDDDCITVKNNPNCQMKVLSVDQCRSGVYKLRVQVSKTLKDLIGNRKIRVLKCILHAFDVPWINICYNCQSFGHVSSNCTGDPICGKCAGAHSTRDCDSSVSCCINCTKLGHENANHCTFSRTCPVLQDQFK